MDTFIPLFEEARLHRQSGSHVKAIMCYQKIIDLDPPNELAWYNMGNAYFDLKEWSHAITCHRRTVEINPAKQEAWHNLGDAYLRRSNLARKEDLLKGIKCYRKAIEINPAAKESWTNLGAIYNVMGDLDNAYMHLKKSLELEPNQPGAWHVLGLVYWKKGNIAEAKKCFRLAGR